LINCCIEKVPYLEGWKVVELANEILGFNGWSNQVISQTVDFVFDKVAYGLD